GRRGSRWTASRAARSGGGVRGRSASQGAGRGPGGAGRADRRRPGRDLPGARRRRARPRDERAAARGAVSSRRGRVGTVYLVGAGPGDPELITVRGRQLLSRAHVVIADALASSELLRHAPQQAEVVRAGKRGGRGGPGQAYV